MIYLIGTGPMAVEYFKVITALNQPITVIGRGEASATNFFSVTGNRPFVGGLSQFLASNQTSPNDSFIIATGTEALLPNLLAILKVPFKSILVEKPAALSIEQLLDDKETLLQHKDRIFVAYNRRFYASVIEAKRLIDEDNGLLSMHFEFTEWAHKIDPLVKAPGVKENWFFANSTHVVNLAFFLAGKPSDWSAYSRAGQLSWHEKTAFCGAGITENDVLFSYNSNWESAGRWSLELLTYKRRIILKPLEGILIQEKGSVEIKIHEFNDEWDKVYKPGLYKMIVGFLTSDYSDLVTIGEQISDSEMIYKKIIGK